jgi:hypothetical protein
MGAGGAGSGPCRLGAGGVPCRRRGAGASRGPARRALLRTCHPPRPRPCQVPIDQGYLMLSAPRRAHTPRRPTWKEGGRLEGGEFQSLFHYYYYLAECAYKESRTTWRCYASCCGAGQYPFCLSLASVPSICTIFLSLLSVLASLRASAPHTLASSFVPPPSFHHNRPAPLTFLSSSPASCPFLHFIVMELWCS